MGEAQCKQVLCEQVLPCVFNLRTLWQMHAVKGHDGSSIFVLADRTKSHLVWVTLARLMPNTQLSMKPSFWNQRT